MDTDNFRDPYDRLDELEAISTAYGLALQQVSIQVKDHSKLGVNLSSHMMEMIRLIDTLSNNLRQLEYRIEQLEKQ